MSTATAEKLQRVEARNASLASHTLRRPTIVRRGVEGEPTPEVILAYGNRLHAPVTDQRSRRDAYRVTSRMEALRDVGKISEPEYRAALKMERHYLGALGVDVRAGDDPGGHEDLEAEEAVVYHGQMLAEMRKLLSSEQYRALCEIIQDQATLEEIGRRAFADLAISNRPQAYIAGLVLIKIGLRVIVDRYGMG